MRDNISVRKFCLTILALCTFGIGQMWGEKAKYVFLNPSAWNNSGAWYAVYFYKSTNDDKYWSGTTQVPNTGIWYAPVPSGFDKMIFVRMSSGSTLTDNNDTNWSNKWNKSQTFDVPDVENYCSYIATECGDGSGVSSLYGREEVGHFYYIEAGTTVYFDNTNSQFGSVHLRLGRHGKDNYEDGENKYRYTSDYTMTLVPGTNALYKHSFESAWIGYEAFAFGNNCGATGGYSVYNMSSGDYLISKRSEFFYTNINASSYTVIGGGIWSGKKDNTDYYNSASSSRSRLTYTITNTSVDHATVELYYWDESDVRRIVTEGSSAEVLPTTKVWCKVTPDDGYAVTKVILSDPTEREWTDASNDASGRNLYVVRTNVSFSAVIEPYATKTILVKDINSWAPNMYFKGWNPFLYEGYDNSNYHITTQKVADKVNVCGEDYYIITFTNEFPFYYMHNEGEGTRTAFFTPSRLTHMQKYNNTTDGDGNWGLQTTGCTGAIYWIETSKDGKKYISNVVASTNDTISFYVPSNGKVDFHAGASEPIDKYHTHFASFFNSGGTLFGKSGGVFTAKTNGSDLTDIAVFDGDYHIHVNAETRNYLNAGGVGKEGTTGTLFTKFDKSAIFGDIYDHYWVDWFLGSGDGKGAQSVIATVGNKYNANLAGILGADEFAPKGMTQSAGGNVRYAYNPETNYFARAIVSAAGDQIKIAGLADADSVQVYNGSSYENATPISKKSFTDATYWNYQIKAKVRGTAHANVTTSYGGGSQTLANQKKLFGGDKNAEPYTVEITYDFKTNRLIAAWTPPNEALNNISLESNLILERVENGAPHVLNINSGKSLTNISQIYMVMKFTKDYWADASRTITGGGYKDAYYWISLPYDCHVSDVFGLEDYGSSGNWVIQTYHGDYRAEKGWWAETENWWYNLGREDVMKANQGYVVRLTNLDSGSGPFTKDGVTEVRLYFPSAQTDLSIGRVQESDTTTTVPEHLCTKWRGEDTSEHEGDPNYDRRVIDSNWNIIGSPSFNTAKITDTGWAASLPDTTGGHYEDYIPKQIPLKYFYTWDVDDNKGRYTIKAGDDVNSFAFQATHAYLVQYAGTITWEPFNNSTDPLVGIKKAPAQANEEQSGDQTLRLVLNKDGKQADVAYISRMAEGATEGYDLNIDLSKLMSKSGDNLYTFAGYYKMAGNCLPDTVSSVPVGVQLAHSGEYTFALPDGSNGIGAVLVDKATDTRTNLGLTDYTVALEAGTYNNRFSLELSPMSPTPTDVKEITDDGSLVEGARKVLMDGTLYIVRDGKVFDARGTRIQ